jgi:AcrR family transcriptional regulator
VPAIVPAESIRQDRRHLRHEATKREILDTAWSMVSDEGLNGLSLRALARAVAMEPQSLYTYFSSKHAVYDHLFADGNRQLLQRMEQFEATGDRQDVLSRLALLFVTFAAEDRARYELLFLRTVPDFEPSPESYAIATEVFEQGRTVFRAQGFEGDAAFDLWTAVVAGLASQQVANDPGGDRYLRLVDDASAMFIGHVAQSPPTAD